MFPGRAEKRGRGGRREGGEFILDLCTHEAIPKNILRAMKTPNAASVLSNAVSDYPYSEVNTSCPLLCFQDHWEIRWAIRLKRANLKSKGHQRHAAEHL